MKHLALMTVFNAMMTLDSGLLFGATLYSLGASSNHVISVCIR